MSSFWISLGCCVALFFAIVLSGTWGHKLGRRIRNIHGTDLSTSTADAAILSLLGLLIAFTFSNSYARYESRRRLIVDEVNAIGTALLRLDLLPVKAQSELRDLFRQYIHSRYELWIVLSNHKAAIEEYRHSQDLQSRIWSKSVQATEHETQGDARKLLLPALNDMIDITTTRLVAVQAHPPLIIFLALSVFAVAAGMLIGFGMAGHERPSNLHLAGFAAAVALSLYVTLDIEYPHAGFVRLDAEHQLLTDLEQSLK